MSVQETPIGMGVPASMTVRVFNDHRGVRRRRRPSGWPALMGHAVALPSGIPPGRSRPEPDGHPAS